MATNFTFKIESDGLTAEQAQTFSAFVKSLQKEEAAAKEGFSQKQVNDMPVYAPVDMAEVFTEKANVAATAKRRRAPKFEIPEAAAEEAAVKDEARQKAYDLEMEEDRKETENFRAEEQADRDAQKKADLDAQEVAPDQGTPQPVCDVTLDTLKKLVSAKQANHRDAIKAYFTKRDGARTSTLPEEFYQEFFDLLTSMN
jgi:hypothetical protein